MESSIQVGPFKFSSLQLAGDSKSAPACILCTYGETENKGREKTNSLQDTCPYKSKQDEIKIIGHMTVHQPRLTLYKFLELWVDKKLNWSCNTLHLY